MIFLERTMIYGELIGSHVVEPFEVDGILYEPRTPPQQHTSAMFSIELDHLCDPDDNDYCNWRRLEARRVVQ